MVRASDFENESILIRRLKAINKILRSPDASVIERYAAVAELALMKNTDRMEVGLLTRGLFDDTNHQIRKMAADALIRYELQDTVMPLLPLLENGRSGLKQIFNGHKDELNAYLKHLKPLFQRKWVFGRGTIDYGLRHALAILENFGRWLGSQSLDDREIEDEEPIAGLDISAPAQQDTDFTAWLEDTSRNWLLKYVQEALESSQDIFCRRAAIKVLGELMPGSAEHCASIYAQIRQAIDQPQNRDDYRVTWDALLALTAITQRYPEDYINTLRSDLLAIFRQRTYSVGKADLEETHRYITRYHCIEALGKLRQYEPLRLLTEGERPEPHKFSMMSFNQKSRRVDRAVGLMKRGYIRAFRDIYLAEIQQSPDHVTETQENILMHIREWASSKDKKVREQALEFFQQLPNVALALHYLVEGASKNDEQLALALQPLSDSTGENDAWHVPEQAKDLLDQRKQFAIALRNILARSSTVSLDGEPILLQVIKLLHSWVRHPVALKDNNNEEHSSKIARIEALWALYQCETRQEQSVLMALTRDAWPQQLADLINDKRQREPAVLSILHIFSALYDQQSPEDRLRAIARSSDAEYARQIRVCAEMELLIRQLLEDLSDDLIAYLPAHVGTGADTEIHYSLVKRFFPVLATFDTRRASLLIEELLRQEQSVPEALIWSLREKLSLYHCNVENNRNFFFNRLLQDLPLRNTDTGCRNLRLDYLNLLRAGMFQHPRGEHVTKKQATSEDELQRRVQIGLQSIAAQFKEHTLPVVFSSEDPQEPLLTKDAECVAILPELNETTVCTTLYASLSQQANQRTLKSYLSVEMYHPRALLFLDRARTDAEIAYILRKRINRAPQQGEQVQKLDILLVGRISRVEDDGAHVDVGLRTTIFVSRKQMIGTDAGNAGEESWSEFARQSIGTLMLFRVRTITFGMEGTEEVIKSMVIQRDYTTSQLKTPTVKAQLKQIETSDQRARFRAQGIDIRVSLRELSWQNQQAWLRGGWKKWFEDRIGQTYELTLKTPPAGTPYWSLREQPASLESFLHLLYQKGNRPFTLTYVGLEEGKGYIFEIEPGTNCYVPADRLGHEEDKEDGQFRFLLPNTTLEPGNQLPVHFKIIKLHNEEQAVLVHGAIDTSEYSGKKYPRGMLMSGELIFADKGSGKLKVAGPLADATVLIHGLPTKEGERIPLGAQVSGHVTSYDPYKEQLELEFTRKPVEDLAADTMYYCRIVSQSDDKILLRHAHVTGYLYENNMTYGHTPVLQDYCKEHRANNTLLPARLRAAPQWESVYKRSITARERREVLAGLGITDIRKLDGGYAIQGHVISALRHTYIKAVHQDGDIERVFQLSLNHFSFENMARPNIDAGNRITLTYNKHQPKDFTLTVEKATAHFTMLADPFQEETWTALDEALPIDVSRKCIYIGRFRSYYLLEAEPGVVFPLPIKKIKDGARCINELGQWSLHDEPWRWRAGCPSVEVLWTATQTVQRYPVHPGDVLALMQHGNGDILLHSYCPGPLHFAATPRRFAAHQALEPWMQQASKKEPLHLTVKVLPFSRDNGKIVELAHIHAGDTDIPVRSRIQAQFPGDLMSEPHRQSCLESECPELDVVLTSPPERLNSSRLLVTVKSPGHNRNAKTQPAASLADILHELQPGECVSGAITYYDRKQRSFRVKLDIVSDFVECTCWLPADEVSFNLERSYNYDEALAQEQPDEFTILDIDVSGREIYVGLRDNPRQDIESVAREEHWLDGQRLDNIVYIGPEAQADRAAEEDEEEDEGEEAEAEAPDAQEMPESVARQNSATPTAQSSISLELRPGTIITLPARCLRRERAHNLRPGDQIAVRVSAQENRPLELHVTWFRHATFNVLCDLHRIVRARVGEYTDGKYRLELHEHRRLPADIYLAPDPQQTGELSRSQLSGYDLFRFSRSDFRKRELYFEPVLHLQKYDLLTVTYREVAGEQGIYVSYGQDRQGFVYRSHISHDPDFTLQNFNPEADKEVFTARVIREADDKRDVMLSIKDAYVHPVSRLEEFCKQQDASDRRFAVLVSQHTASIDLQLYVGTIIRIPFNRINNRERLRGARAGDKVEFKLETVQPRYMNISVLDVIHSPARNLHPRVLVQARLQRRDEQRWRFALPEYNDREGIMYESAETVPDILRSDLYLAVEQVPNSPTDPITLRLRKLNDQQQVVRVESIEPGRIRVRCENGQTQWLNMLFVTYRVNNRISYIKETLPPESILLATNVLLATNTRSLCLTDNRFRPITLAALYKERGRAEIELTYVQRGDEGEHHLFELRPGLFVRIPSSTLSFYGYPLSDLPWAMPGDVFTVRCEAAMPGEQEQLQVHQVQVQRVHLSALRYLRRDQIIHAEVTRVAAGGVIIRADEAHLQGEFVNDLFPRTSPLPENSHIWLRVMDVRPEKGKLVLKECHPPAREGRSALVYGDIIQRTRNNVTLRFIHNLEATVPLAALSWSRAEIVADVLPSDIKGLWVALTSRPGTMAHASPREFLAPQLAAHLKAGDIIPAQVISCNQDRQVKSAVLDIEGAFVQLPQEEIVRGLPPHLVGIKQGTWLLVAVQKVPEADDNSRSTLIVSARAVSTHLDSIPPDTGFKALVCYTLEHGLVFSYYGTLGYVANEEITWTSEMSAADLFQPGETIRVYKREDATFSLKHQSQLARLQEDEDVDARIMRATDQDLYLKLINLGSTDIWVVLRRDQVRVAVNREPGSLHTFQVKRIDRNALRLDLKLLTEAAGERSEISAPGVALHRIAYLPTIHRFIDDVRKQRDTTILTPEPVTALTHKSNRPVGTRRSMPTESSSDERTRKELLEPLSTESLPCTYYTVRRVLGALWKSTNDHFWQSPAIRHAQTERRYTLSYVLSRIASALNQGQHEPEAENDVDRDDLQAFHLESIVHYAIGITALFPSKNRDLNIPPFKSLKRLLLAYHCYKAVDIEIALMLLYNRLGFFELRRKFLEAIIQRFVRNLGWLLTIPQPVYVQETDYFRPEKDPYKRTKRKNVIGELNALATRLSEGDRIDRVEEELARSDKYLDGGIVDLTSLHPALLFNQALCCTFLLNNDQALDRLQQCEQTIEQALADERRKRVRNSAYQSVLGKIREKVYQLTMYLYYHQENFKQLQDFVASHRLYGDASINTWLGYMFFAAGYKQLSQDLIEREEYSSPEALLLSLYWQDSQQSTPAPLKDCLCLEDLLFHNLAATNQWGETRPIMRFLPGPLPLTTSYNKLEAARTYQARNYVLNQYLDDPSYLTGKNHFMIEAGLYTGRIDAISNLLQGDIAKYIEQKSGKLIERWLKSPYDRDTVSTNFFKLIMEQKEEVSDELYMRYWLNPILRNQLWSVFDYSMDYGQLIYYLPETISISALEALEDVVFHLLAVGLIQDALSLIDACEDGDDSNAAARMYLSRLRELCQEEISEPFRQRLTYLLSLRQQPYQPGLAERLSDPTAAFEALNILIQYPDRQRQIPLHLMLGELLEHQGQYTDAFQHYTLAGVLPEQTPLQRKYSLSRALLLLRLHLSHPEINGPDPTAWPEADQLVCSLQKALAPIHMAQEHPAAEVLTRLYMLTATLNEQGHIDQDRIEDFLLQTEDMFRSMSQREALRYSLPPLYETFIGTAALERWSTAQIWRMLCLFIDYAFYTRMHQELAECAEQTLSKTIDQYEQNNTSSETDRIPNELKQQEKDFLALEEWLLKDGLCKAPENIERVASAMLAFFTTREKACLSSEKFHKATRQIVEKLGSSHPAYGPATRQLIKQAGVHIEPAIALRKER